MEALIVVGLAAALAGAASACALEPEREALAREHPAWRGARHRAGFAISGGGDSAKEPAQRGTNPIALAALIRQGPFTEQLPSPLRASGIEDVNIADASAANRVDAVQLKARWPGDTLSSFFAHLEVYRSADAAFERSQARIREIKKLYGPEVIRGSSESYCAYLDQDGTWECGGSRGLEKARVAGS